MHYLVTNRPSGNYISTLAQTHFRALGHELAALPAFSLLNHERATQLVVTPALCLKEVGEY